MSRIEKGVRIDSKRPAQIHDRTRSRRVVGEEGWKLAIDCHRGYVPRRRRAPSDAEQCGPQRLTRLLEPNDVPREGVKRRSAVRPTHVFEQGVNRAQCKLARTEVELESRLSAGAEVDPQGFEVESRSRDGSG